MNTPESAKKLKQAFPQFDEEKINYVTNGFDFEDFKKQSSSPKQLKKDRFNIVHTGTFHTDLGLRQKRQALINFALGRTIRGVRFLPRSPYYLLHALAQLIDEEPDLAKRLHLVCTGMSGQSERRIASELDLDAIVTIESYIPHEESVSYLQQADMLFLPMHHLPKGMNASIVPGKTYEYLASRTPILAAVPKGDAKTFIEQAGGHYVCEPESVSQMKSAIKAEMANWESATQRSQASSQGINQFERIELTKKLATILKDASF